MVIVMLMYYYMLFVMHYLGAFAWAILAFIFLIQIRHIKILTVKYLLQKTIELVKKQGYSVVNIDTTLCLQEPKIKPYVEQMQKAIAGITEITEKDISIKATTTEQMGFVGREEGLMAYALCY